MKICIFAKSIHSDFTYATEFFFLNYEVCVFHCDANFKARFHTYCFIVMLALSHFFIHMRQYLLKLFMFKIIPEVFHSTVIFS